MNERASACIASVCGELAFDGRVGHLSRLVLRDGVHSLSPLAHAPWVDEPDDALPEGLSAVERHLSGDFLCAPFGASEVEEAPPHGWSANSHWTVIEEDGDGMAARLDRPVMGAGIRKVLRLSQDAPLLFQEHWIEGGDGYLTVAHHPMVRLEGTGRFACSRKRAALAPDAPLEPGRNRLEAGAATSDLIRFPGTGGQTVDLTALPIGDAHEDFVTLVEADENELGWSAILRDLENDIVFFLKDPAVLPVTMLWHSNAGRDYAPWNGRHRGVVGVEDGCTAGAAGHRAAMAENPVSDLGVPSSLSLDAGTSHRIAHVIGAISRPDGWSTMSDIRLAGDDLVLTGDTGATRRLPFPRDFFKKGA